MQSKVRTGRKHDNPQKDCINQVRSEVHKRRTMLIMQDLMYTRDANREVKEVYDLMYTRDANIGVKE